MLSFRVPHEVGALGRQGHREEGRPLVEALAHSRCLAPTPGEAPTDASYLGPVGPAAHLLHDGLVGQPVVQPRHVLTIGPEEGAGGGEATRLSSAGSLGVIRHLAQHLSPGRDGSDSAPAVFAQKDFEKAHNLLHIFCQLNVAIFLLLSHSVMSNSLQPHVYSVNNFKLIHFFPLCVYTHTHTLIWASLVV